MSRQDNADGNNPTLGAMHYFRIIWYKCIQLISQVFAELVFSNRALHGSGHVFLLSLISIYFDIFLLLSAEVSLSWPHLSESEHSKTTLKPILDFAVPDKRVPRDCKCSTQFVTALCRAVTSLARTVYLPALICSRKHGYHPLTQKPSGDAELEQKSRQDKVSSNILFQ